MTATVKVLESASGALTVLSKIRCVESYSFGDDVRYKVILPWPSKFETCQETKEWLKAYGIHVNERLRVQAYPVSYSDYENRPVIKTPDLVEIRSERNVITWAMIAAQINDIEEISCIWDAIEHPNIKYPLNTKDIEVLREFATYSDAMLGFKKRGNNYYYKVPAFTGAYLFEEVGLFNNHEITPKNMASSSGENTDHRNRANRLIVHRGHAHYLEAVFRSSIEALQKAVSESWSSKLRAFSTRHYEAKHS